MKRCLSAVSAHSDFSLLVSSCAVTTDLNIAKYDQIFQRRHLSPHRQSNMSPRSCLRRRKVPPPPQCCQIHRSCHIYKCHIIIRITQCATYPAWSTFSTLWNGPSQTKVRVSLGRTQASKAVPVMVHSRTLPSARKDIVIVEIKYLIFHFHLDIYYPNIRLCY